MSYTPIVIHLVQFLRMFFIKIYSLYFYIKIIHRLCPHPTPRGYMYDFLNFAFTLPQNASTPVSALLSNQILWRMFFFLIYFIYSFLKIRLLPLLPHPCPGIYDFQNLIFTIPNASTQVSAFLAYQSHRDLLYTFQCKISTPIVALSQSWGS